MHHDIATNNLITKVSFENHRLKEWNQWVGTAVTYAPLRQAYKGSASSFISYSTVASSLVNIKSVTVAGLIQILIQGNPVHVTKNN
jgi:hypothetical protein